MFMTFAAMEAGGGGWRGTGGGNVEFGFEMGGRDPSLKAEVEGSRRFAGFGPRRTGFPSGSVVKLVESIETVPGSMGASSPVSVVTKLSRLVAAEIRQSALFVVTPPSSSTSPAPEVGGLIPRPGRRLTLRFAPVTIE